MRRIKLVEHLSVEELGQRYRRAREPVERTRWQMLWLLSQGQQARHVAAVTGYGAKWVGQVAQRYNAQGPTSVPKRRGERVGRRLVSPALAAQLTQALQAAAPDGGLWTSPKVAAWLADRLGRPVSPQRGWEALRRLGYTPQRPRPRHQQADAAAPAAFRKASATPSSKSSKLIPPRS
jgi:transposase